MRTPAARTYSTHSSLVHDVWSSTKFSQKGPETRRRPGRSFHEGLLQEGLDDLVRALDAIEAGPNVPPGHRRECGSLGLVDRGHERVCANIDCGSYHTSCEDGPHPPDAYACDYCRELEGVDDPVEATQ